MDILGSVSDADVDGALPKIAEGLKKYCWLQANLNPLGMEFQQNFKGFYKVRRDEQWCEWYFGLMEESNRNRMSFKIVLNRLWLKTGWIEASFASKLVATLEPQLPVIDKFVLKNLNMRLPYFSKSDREHETVEVYKQLCAKYDELLASAKGRMICKKFQRKYRDSEITEVKMIDLVLWKIRESGKIPTIYIGT